MNVQSLPSMTVDQFFDWCATQERRFELVGGVPRMQPYVKHNHSTVVMNLSALLWNGIDRNAYHIATSDFGVETGEKILRFPDVLVFAADTAPAARVAAKPVLIVEVLSDSTHHIDFGDKRHEYLALDSLDSYLVLSQEKPHVWLWSRGGDGAWPDDPVILEGMKADLALPLFGLTIPLSAIYAGVN
jgi:Uma2 family endonuclease